MLSTPFAGRNTPNDIRAVFDHLLRVKRTFFTCETLNDYSGILVD
jgi:hypothetical protein